jgi:predicted transcriptional regulator
MRSFTLKLPSQLIDSLDRYAAAHSAHRSTVARNVLAQGLEALEGN